MEDFLLPRSKVQVQQLQLICARGTSKNPGSKTTVPRLSGPVPWSEEAEISGSPINHYVPPGTTVRPIVSGCPTLLKATPPVHPQEGWCDRQCHVWVAGEGWQKVRRLFMLSCQPHQHTLLWCVKSDLDGNHSREDDSQTSRQNQPKVNISTNSEAYFSMQSRPHLDSFARLGNCCNFCTLTQKCQA